jgi:hypothetical protein
MRLRLHWIHITAVIMLLTAAASIFLAAQRSPSRKEAVAQSCPSSSEVRSTPWLVEGWWSHHQYLVTGKVQCAGPYVLAEFTGGRILLIRQRGRLKFLTAGSDYLCTVRPSNVVPGQIVYVPPKYGHRMPCVDGDRMA